MTVSSCLGVSQHEVAMTTRMTTSKNRSIVDRQCMLGWFWRAEFAGMQETYHIVLLVIDFILLVFISKDIV